MALVVADRVQETSTTSGTGTLTLSGAVVGFQTFSTAIGNGNTTFYTIYDPTVYDWEVGIGTIGAGTLARTTVLSNSAGTTSQISFAGNAKFVFCTYPAEKSINYDANGVATIGEVLGYSDTGIVGSFASTVAGYNQVIVQNKSTATNASANLNVSNDAGTSGSNYAELGINSSTFTGSGSFNIAGASYVASASTDLTLGTYGAYNVHFVTNSSTTDAMTIYNNGGISLGTFGNPGIGNMAASKFVPGYTAVTSAAGTTVLTADSNYYQNLLGSTTQTFQLPDATTLLVGTTFIFDNDSSGTLTVVDNASGPIETIPGGAAGFVYLAVNATVAGTWRRHAFLPASYDFNNTTANFGNATITNALWNGTTIGTAYGGTGLTTFSAANYALYSTNASTLTAGTLPVAAGGSGAVTFTANGVLYGDGTNPLGVTAAGTTGQVLVGNTGGAPSWATLSGSTVSSFSAGTTGLTPNTATTGAVTLGGTLDVDNGGTGQTTYTDGQLLIGNTTGNTLTKATLTGTASQVDVTNGNGSITLSLPSTINVNTSGSAATLTTSRDIYGNSFNGSANVTGIIASTYGGTGNGFTKFSGPTTSEKTFTLPDATATILTTNAAITPTQGGTGLTSYTTGDIIYASATNTLSTLADVATGNALISGGVGVAPSWGKIGLTTHVSGTLPTANGGTNLTSFTSGGAVYATSTSVLTTGTLPVASGGTGTATAFTTGSVVFAGASGIYTQDNANFFWDDTNNRLGIGTTSPSTKLNIYDASLASVLVQSDSTTNVIVHRASTDTSAGALAMRKARGTIASPSAVASGDNAGQILYQVFGGTNNRNVASINGFVSTYTSDTDISGYLTFSTSPSGSAAVTEAVRIESDKNLKLSGSYQEGVVAIGTVTTSNTLSLANGTVQTATLTASTACTFTMPTATAGKSFILLLKQAAATGNGSATFTGVKFPTAGAPTITTTAGKMDILTFVADGTNWYGSYVQGYTP